MKNESGELLLADPVSSDECYVRAYFCCDNVVQPADILALMFHEKGLFACAVFCRFISYISLSLDLNAQQSTTYIQAL